MAETVATADVAVDAEADAEGAAQGRQRWHGRHDAQGEQEDAHGLGEAMADELSSDEQAHFDRIASAFRAYMHMNVKRVQKAARDWGRFRAVVEGYLAGFDDKLQTLEQCLHANQRFLDVAVEPHQLFENEDLQPRVLDTSRVTEADADKVRSTLRQCMRDWSVEGQGERDQCYRPLLEELARRFPDDRYARRDRVPIPAVLTGTKPEAGSPLRAAHGTMAAVARVRAKGDKNTPGFQAQGNEVSYFMLLVSDMIMNRITPDDGYDIFPFVHQFSNVWTPEDQVRAVRIPDIQAGGLPEGATLSMVAGDFMEVYNGQDGAWDAVVTCFFVDTARNVVDYVRLIHRLLRPGGVWINLGPLLYHYEDMDGEPSLELSYTELRAVVHAIGFTMETEGRRHCTYAANSRSMYHVIYDCVFFCASKPTGVGPTAAASG